MRRGNKIGKEATFIDTNSFLKELNEYSKIIQGENLNVYVSTDDPKLIDEIEKKYDFFSLFLIFYVNLNYEKQSIDKS